MSVILKNIIFDFGNVLLNINMVEFKYALQKLIGVAETDQLLLSLDQRNVFKLYETGGLNTQELFEQIRYHAPRHVHLSDAELEDAWNSIFIGMPPHRFEMLLELRKRYRVFLLSNINEMHLDWITAYMQREYQITDFEQRHFEAVYYSHLIRLRKPDASIYEYVLADADLKPEETVFFDDLPENIAAADALGIRGQWHDPQREIKEHLTTLGLLRAY